MVMGCHGIGVSKIIPAIAEGYSDHNGLCWPRVVAPYDVVLAYGCIKKNAAVPQKEGYRSRIQSPGICSYSVRTSGDPPL